MKFFGYEITRNKGNKLDELIKGFSDLNSRQAEKLLNELNNTSLFNGGFIDPNKIIENTRNDFINQIKWPSADHLDEFELIEYNKARYDLLKSASSGRGGHFSICPFHTFKDLGFFECEGLKKEAYKKLSKLHCVDFVNIPPETRRKSIKIINFLFDTDDSNIIEGELGNDDQKFLN